MANLVGNNLISADQQITQTVVPALLTTKVVGIKNIVVQGQNWQTPDIVAFVTIEESHFDDLVITEHPIQIGAGITDYAYKLPSKVKLKMGWSNSPQPDSGENIAALAQNFLAAYGGQIGVGISNLYDLGLAGYNLFNSSDVIYQIYQDLVDLQNNLGIFDLYTNKRTYNNMMIQSLYTETDSKTINSLPITMECRQVIIVDTLTTKLSADKTSSIYQATNPSNTNVGTSSIKPVSKPTPGTLGR